MATKMRAVGIWLAALLLAMVLGILVAHEAGAQGRVLWKQTCPVWAGLEYVQEPDGSGVHVLCVLGDEKEVER